MPGSILATEPQLSRSDTDSVRRHPVTIEDAIAETRLADPDYFSGAPSKGRVAEFSPDGEQFVVVLRKGNLADKTNEYSLYLFQANQPIGSPPSSPILSMS